MNNIINFETTQGTRFSLQFSINNKELCELYEHNGFPAWKHALYSQVFSAFEAIIDLTPGFGYFSINSATMNKNNSYIGLREEQTDSTTLLKSNLTKNNIKHIFHFSSDPTNNKLKTRDISHHKTIIRTTSALILSKFIKDTDINDNPASLLIENYGKIAEHKTLLNRLIKINYQLFEYCPFSKKLSPFSITNELITRRCDIIFCFSSYQVRKLKNQGILLTHQTFPESTPKTSWKTILPQRPYARSLLGKWKNSPHNPAYIQVLNHSLLAFSEKNTNHLMQSYDLLKTLDINELTFTQLLTAIRICFELGDEAHCNKYLVAAINEFQSTESLNFNEPFLPPLARYEEFETNSDIASWCLSGVLEAYELNRSDSCFNMNKNDYEQLSLYVNLPHVNNQLKMRHEIYKAMHCIDDDKTFKARPPSLIKTEQSITQKTDELPEIAILYHMARTGGTLISKCIACIDGNILLSELHPDFSVSHPLDQAGNWFNLFDVNEKEKLKTYLSYVDSIREIQRRTQKLDKHLIIRDWSHIDFTGIPFVDLCSYQLTQADTLKPFYKINQLATVRHPVDAYLSLSKLAIMKNKLTVENYLKGAKQFSIKARKIGFVRYEDFCQSPKTSLAKICDKLNINYDDDFLHNFNDYHKITGDTASPHRSPNNEIRASSHQKVDTTLEKQFSDNQDYWEILEILDYKDHLRIGDQNKRKRTEAF